MTKHDAVKAYFEPKVLEIAGNVLNFNFSAESQNSVALVTNYSDRVVKRFVTGGARKRYGFTIIITLEYASNDDDQNLIAINFAQEFMDWIEERNRRKLFPDFGDKCQIEKMQNMQNMPNLSYVNAEQGLARYMLQCEILYREEKENDR